MRLNDLEFLAMINPPGAVHQDRFEVRFGALVDLYAAVAVKRKNKKSLAAELSPCQSAGHYVRPHAETAPGFFIQPLFLYAILKKQGTSDSGPRGRGLHPRSKLRGVRPKGNE